MSARFPTSVVWSSVFPVKKSVNFFVRHGFPPIRVVDDNLALHGPELRLLSARRSCRDQARDRLASAADPDALTFLGSFEQLTELVFCLSNAVVHAALFPGSIPQHTKIHQSHI